MYWLLKKYKKYFPEIKTLFDYQETVLELLCQRKNTLAIIPTGGGKSLLYQLLSLELEGITLVISPLLALMEEQVADLNKNRKIPSLALNSKISFVEQREILRTLHKRDYKLIYVSPERLQNPFFRASIIASGVKISMIVVDEAHCISEWGSSFRPDYGQIDYFAEFLKSKNQSPFLLCLTATMSKKAREDMVTGFHIDEENVFVTSKIVRSNLKLHATKVTKEKEKENTLRIFLTEYKPTKTIAYLYSQLKCEEYAEAFSDEYSTDFYHASVDPDEKTAVYNRFLSNETEILFATTAFGMGINIPDIESIVHIHIPNSIEEYYQQVGRGWRRKDLVKDCNCLALWSDKNFSERKRDLKNQRYTRDDLIYAYKLLVGPSKKLSVRQVVNKDKESLVKSDYNLQLIRHKLERYGIIKTIGELNGSPLTIELNTNTPLWTKIKKEAEDGIDSFIYVCDSLEISIEDVIRHLYEQDLRGNIKKVPAMSKDVFFEVLHVTIDYAILDNIVGEINAEIDFKVQQLDELKALFLAEDKESILSKALK